MKSYTPSKTARAVVSALALESNFPASLACCNDTDAINFTPWFVRLFNKVPFSSKLTRWFLGDRLSGLYYCAARARYMNDYIEDNSEIAQQLVILGAGYETIGFKSSFKHMMIFEVDHPYTQDNKLKIIRKKGLKLNNDVKFIAQDILNVGLVEKLISCGLDIEKPTIIKMSGLSMYLTEDANKRIMESISNKINASVYMIYDVIIPNNHTMQTRKELLFERVSQYGEKFLWCPSIKDVRNMMDVVGFNDIIVADTNHLKQKYYLDRVNAIKMDSFFNIVSAIKHQTKDG